MGAKMRNATCFKLQCPFRFRCYRSQIIAVDQLLSYAVCTQQRPCDCFRLDLSRLTLLLLSAMAGDGNGVHSEDGVPEGQVYTPKNILITGAAGFIGSHVAIRLCKQYPQYKVRMRPGRGQYARLPVP